MVSKVLNNLVQRLSLWSIMVHATLHSRTLVSVVECETLAASWFACLGVNGEVEVEAHIRAQGGFSILDQFLTSLKISLLTFRNILAAGLRSVRLRSHGHQGPAHPPGVILVIIHRAGVAILLRDVLREVQSRSPHRLLLSRADSGAVVARRYSAYFITLSQKRLMFCKTNL